MAVPNSILVIDDEPDNFHVIELLLSKQNYQLSYVNNGLNIISCLDKIQPDLILLDIMMPEVDGIEVCTEIKSHPHWQHIPIIIVTALSSKKDLASCLSAGADDFISKPISALELRARVASMLRIKKQYDALEASLKSLESHLQFREDMSHMIVHDLRNPIASITMGCDLLLKTELQPLQKQKLERILLSGQRLRLLTDNLLMVAKMESGRMKLNLVEVDLCKMAEQVVSDFMDIAAQKNIQIISNLEPLEKLLFLDTNLFRRVLDNLLSNAIKYSSQNSRITVEVFPSDNCQRQAIVQIADHGKGISKELKQQIFEKYEVGNLMNGVFQIGLGLAFCKMAVEAHGGHISIESNQPRGSIFTLEI